MFRNLFGKRKIKVELIEALSNESIDMLKISPDELPSSFEGDTILHIEGENWEVIKAEPLLSSEFIDKGELAIWVRKVLTMDPKNVRFSMPTIAGVLPAMSVNRIFLEFTLTIEPDDWKQFEFLPKDQLPVIQEEQKSIEDILYPKDDENFESLNGFPSIYQRRRIKDHQLHIPLEKFITTLNIQSRGNLAFEGMADFVENGFALKSPGYIYYGILRDDYITDLCISYYESTDDEINLLLDKFDILLVCWCRAQVTAASDRT